MTLRTMKIIFRRAIVGNFVALSVIASVVLLYIALLRYNTANTHFDIRSHEIKKRYIREEPLQIKIPWKKLLHTNVWRGKGGNWTRRIGPNLPLSVFVVEEHHEVIPYWFDAANARAIARHGNTLIHIDGHDDLSLPFYLPIYPSFRWPKTKQDFKLMMQRNDVFITEAVISGLIKRVVWIWPVWDQKNHDKSYHAYKSHIGLTKVKNQDNEMTNVFCICKTDVQTTTNDCVYPDYESDNASMVTIPKSKCRMQKPFVYEEIREDVATKYMSDTKWLGNKDEIILDIDEDFYGCVYASQPMLDSGITEAELNHINQYLGKLVCPKSLQQEKYTDSLFVTVLELYKRFYTCHKSKKSNPSGKCPSLTQVNAEVKSYLLKTLWQNKKIHICLKQHHAVVYAISELVHSFQKLSEKQISAMQRVGFCLNTTPKTFKLTMESQFRLCQGSNTPSDTAVLIHTPTKKDIENRTVTLQNILNSIQSKSVKIATICRSSRDGYTPRRYMTLIESDIMKLLNKTFKSCVAHYDNGLLGGVKGWLARPKKIDKKLKI